MPVVHFMTSEAREQYELESYGLLVHDMMISFVLH